MSATARLDILVNNAATNPYLGPTIDIDLGRYDKTFQVNLRGPLVWTQAAWRAWMQDHGGVVLNVASVGGIRSEAALGIYNMTKAALIHLTKTLAVELAPGVRVNALAPGSSRRSSPAPCGSLPRTSPPPTCRSSGSGSPRTSPTPRCSWPATRGPGSPGTPSSSTAARSCGPTSRAETSGIRSEIRSILAVPLGSRFLVPPPNPLPPLPELRVHLLGIRGAGMTPAALAAQSAGAIVDGCDQDLLEGGDALARAGIGVEVGHDHHHIADGQHLVVTTIADAELAEVRIARAAGRLHHRTDLLAAIGRGRDLIAVTGSHGKGTVAGLLGCGLVELGADPLVVLGARAGALDGPFRRGNGPVILEADDADGTIARIPSLISVVTNSWADHPMFGRSRSEVLDDIGHHLALVPPEGRVILGRARNLRPLAAFSRSPVWVLGRDFEVEQVSVQSGRRVLRIHDPDHPAPLPASVRIDGGNVADNALAAYAALRAWGVPPEGAAGALSALDLLRRRCELVSDRGGVRVFDDLGKHPAALAATIQALRELSPGALHLVYEPFLDIDVLRWRRRWVQAFDLADTTIVLPVDSRTTRPVPRRAPLDWPGEAGSAADLAASRTAAAELVVGRARPGDIVLVAGCHTDLGLFARSLGERFASDCRGGR